jgi:hypothetical protein
MSATSAPFGLRPAFHPSGLDRAIALADGIASAYNTDILKGQPVKLNTSGNIVVAAAGDAFQGAFAGVEWTDTTGRRRVSNYWPANTAYQTGSCVTYYYSDPNIVYEIQQHYRWFERHRSLSGHHEHHTCGRWQQRSNARDQPCSVHGQCLG